MQDLWTSILAGFQKAEKWKGETETFLKNRELDWEFWSKKRGFNPEQPLSTDTKARNKWNQNRMAWSRIYDNTPLIKRDVQLQQAGSGTARGVSTLAPEGTPKSIIKDINRDKGVSGATNRMLNEEVKSTNLDIKESGYKSPVQGFPYL